MADNLEETFIAEAQDFLNTLESQLINAESSSNFDTFLLEANRILHNIKGSAGVASFHQVEKLAHVIESSIQGKKNLENEDIAFMFRGIDLLQSALVGRISEKDLEVFISFASNKSKLAVPEIDSSDGSGFTLFEGSDPSEQTKNQGGRPKLVKNDDESTESANSEETISDDQVPEDVLGDKDEEEASKLNSKKGIILVAEDNLVVANILEHYVKELGFGVVVAHNPDEACNMFDKYSPDLVLSDFNFEKNLNGMNILNYVHERNPVVPFIFISGYINKKIAIEAMACGAIGIIEKPFKRTELVAIIEKQFNRYMAYKLLKKSIHCLWYHIAEVSDALGEHNHELLKNLKRDTIEIIKMKHLLLEGKGVRKDSTKKAS